MKISDKKIKTNINYGGIYTTSEHGTKELDQNINISQESVGRLHTWTGDPLPTPQGANKSNNKKKKIT